MERKGIKGKRHVIRVVGISGCKAPDRFEELISGSVAICSSRRLIQALSTHINSLSPQPAFIPITPLSDMVEKLRGFLSTGDCVVLASGDPLFFGIGKRLLSIFGKERLQFYPALSAVQIACARLKIPWDDAQIISLHGRKGESACGLILSRPRSIIFTDGRNSPDAIAKNLLQALERIGDTSISKDLEIHVAERLECPEERLLTMRLEEAAQTDFSPLNIMVVEIGRPALPHTRGIGLMEDEISHLRGLITKDEIRAVTLHKLRLSPGIVFWDVGAGSGSLSLEASRLYPDLTSFAVEMDEKLQKVIRENIRRLRLFNVVPVDGKAPEILETLPLPHRVFIGGSKGQLEPIIAHCAKALAPGGILVANAVLERTAQDAPRLMKEAGLMVDMSRISVTRHPGSKDKETKLNEITIIRGIKGE